MKRLRMPTLTALVLSAGLAVSAPVTGDETYALLFKNGTLDDVSRSDTLVYERTVTNILKPSAAERNTGAISLSFPAGDANLAHLEFRQDQKHRALGVFPASVGNPMIMVFYEGVVRDMAEAAGGSPFYIRNRVKEALVQPADMEQGRIIWEGKSIPTRTILLRPFDDDPNAERMQGFGNLELRVTMSEAIPGWYLALTAHATGPDGQDVYRSDLQFQRVENFK